MKYKISEKRAEFLIDTFFEYTFKDKELDVKALNDITEPIDLQFIAKNHNYDDGTEILAHIINNPNCDISTAKMIFFRCDVDGYLQLGEESVDFQLISSILINFEKQLYTEERFYYDYKEDSDALSFDEEQARTKLSSQNSLFSKPRGKKIIPSFADNFHQRNLKFYPGYLEIIEADDKLCVNTELFNFEFQIPGDFCKVDQEQYNEFYKSIRFPNALKSRFAETENNLKKILTKPTLLIRNDNLLIVLYLFNSKSLRLKNGVTNAATMLRNELIYIQAFVDIEGVEEGFDKINRIKHDDTWFAISKGMQIKIANIEDVKYLKLILMERDGLLFSLSIVSDDAENLTNEIINDVINKFSIT